MVHSFLLLMALVVGWADEPNPMSHRDLVLWLDAADVDGDGTTDRSWSGQGIAQWRDKSDFGNHLTQQSESARPRLDRREPERPAMKFDGGDSLERRVFDGFSTGDQEFHLIAVMRADPSSKRSAQRLIDLASKPGASGPFAKRAGMWVGQQAGRKKLRLGISHGDEGEGLSNVWDGQTHIVEAAYTGEQGFAIYVDGIREQRATFNGSHFLGFDQTVSVALGQHFGTGNQGTFFEGDLFEVLLFRNRLDAGRRIRILESLGRRHSVETPVSSVPWFETDVKPLLSQYCYRCHQGDTPKANLDLDSVSAMLRGGRAGPVLVRGFPERSELVQKIESGQMPPGEVKLTRQQIEILRDWIDADAPAREAVALKAIAPPISPVEKEHWAFQPIRPVNLPVVTDRHRVRNEIDLFLLNKLEANGLTYSSPADRAALCRRVSFDLTGLPPTPAQLARFLADTSETAYEKLIGRLLASQHFGERWGRYWLDVSGYVDVFGSDNDAAIIKPLPGKWRYRDYVIRSFNEDKPFDRFLTEQLAGDELYDWKSAEVFTPAILDALVATNFLLCANDDTDQNELNTPDIRHHVLQRTTEIVANNLLALTVQCAKCHDHKYEAISQFDYYSLEAVFAPAFNVRQWIVSTAKSRADVSDLVKARIDSENNRIESEIATRKKQIQSIRNATKDRIYTEKLDEIPAPIRDDLQKAIAAKADARSEVQKYLVAKLADRLSVSQEMIDRGLSAVQRRRLERLRSEIAQLPAKEAYGTIQLVREYGPVPRTQILRRGNYLRPGLEVSPRLIGVFADVDRPTRDPGRSQDPVVRGSSGRRLQLARALTDYEGRAGQHVVRVFVNRVWQQMFGGGIVRTSDNFGKSGERPTHPELLDWLAQDFIRNGLRVKPFIKKLALSDGYRQASQASGGHSGHRIDPENKLLWRMNLRRLDSEQVRDAILATSGTIKRQVGGSPLALDVRPDGMVLLKKEDVAPLSAQWRRSVYVLARRNYHLTMLRIFDQPIVARHCTVRQPSAVVTQSLTLLHDDFVLEQARQFAERIREVAPESLDGQIRAAFRMAVARVPSPREVRWSRELIEGHQSQYGGADGRLPALTQFCKVLFNINEFLYVK